MQNFLKILNIVFGAAPSDASVLPQPFQRCFETVGFYGAILRKAFRKDYELLITAVRLLNKSSGFSVYYR